MAKINIDNTEYDLEKLSSEARAQIDMIIMTDQKITELNRDVAIAQTARVAYAGALKKLLEATADSESEDQKAKA